MTKLEAARDASRDPDEVESSTTKAISCWMNVSTQLGVRLVVTVRPVDNNDVIATAVVGSDE